MRMKDGVFYHQEHKHWFSSTGIPMDEFYNDACMEGVGESRFSIAKNKEGRPDHWQDGLQGLFDTADQGPGATRGTQHNVNSDPVTMPAPVPTPKLSPRPKGVAAPEPKLRPRQEVIDSGEASLLAAPGKTEPMLRPSKEAVAAASSEDPPELFRQKGKSKGVGTPSTRGPHQTTRPDEESLDGYSRPVKTAKQGPDDRKGIETSKGQFGVLGEEEPPAGVAGEDAPTGGLHADSGQSPAGNPVGDDRPKINPPPPGTEGNAEEQPRRRRGGEMPETPEEAAHHAARSQGPYADNRKGKATPGKKGEGNKGKSTSGKPGDGGKGKAKPGKTGDGDKGKGKGKPRPAGDEPWEQPEPAPQPRPSHDWMLANKWKAYSEQGWHYVPRAGYAKINSGDKCSHCSYDYFQAGHQDCLGPDGGVQQYPEYQHNSNNPNWFFCSDSHDTPGKVGARGQPHGNTFVWGHHIPCKMSGRQPVFSDVPFAPVKRYGQKEFGDDLPRELRYLITDTRTHRNGDPMIHQLGLPPMSSQGLPNSTQNCPFQDVPDLYRKKLLYGNQAYRSPHEMTGITKRSFNTQFLGCLHQELAARVNMLTARGTVERPSYVLEKESWAPGATPWLPARVWCCSYRLYVDQEYNIGLSTHGRLDGQAGFNSQVCWHASLVGNQERMRRFEKICPPLAPVSDGVSLNPPESLISMDMGAPLYPWSIQMRKHLVGPMGPFRVFGKDLVQGVGSYVEDQHLEAYSNGELRRADSEERSGENYYSLTLHRDAYEELSSMMVALLELAGISCMPIWSNDLNDYPPPADVGPTGDRDKPVFTGVVIPMAHGTWESETRDSESYDLGPSAPLWAGLLSNCSEFWQQPDIMTRFGTKEKGIRTPQLIIGWYWTVYADPEEVPHWSFLWEENALPGLEHQNPIRLALKKVLHCLLTADTRSAPIGSLWSGRSYKDPQGKGHGDVAAFILPRLYSPFPLPLIPTEGWTRMAMAQMAMTGDINPEMLRPDRSSPFYRPLIFNVFARRRPKVPQEGAVLTRDLGWAKVLAFPAPGTSTFRHPYEMKDCVWFCVEPYDINADANSVLRWVDVPGYVHHTVARMPLWVCVFERKALAVPDNDGFYTIIGPMHEAVIFAFGPTYIASADTFGVHHPDSPHRSLTMGKRMQDQAMKSAIVLRDPILLAAISAEAASQTGRQDALDMLLELELLGQRLSAVISTYEKLKETEIPHGEDSRHNTSAHHLDDRGAEHFCEKRIARLKGTQEIVNERLSGWVDRWGGTVGFPIGCLNLVPSRPCPNVDVVPNRTNSMEWNES